MCVCVDIIIVSNENSVIKNVSAAQGAAARKGLEFLGCYATAQNSHQNERLPRGGCSYHYRSTAVCNSWQQEVDKHGGGSGRVSYPAQVLKRKLFFLCSAGFVSQMLL